MIRIGVDVGGTFTDFVMAGADATTLCFHKTPSTPHDPSEAIETGLRALFERHAIDPAGVAYIGHGTTVATNALLERKGDRTVLVTNKGFRDALRLAYQNRPRLFDRNIILPETLYETVIETAGRFDAVPRCRPAVSGVSSNRCEQLWPDSCERWPTTRRS